MTTKPKKRAALAPGKATLAEVLAAFETKKLPATRLRDLRSATTRVAKLLGGEPARIPLDLPAISAKLAAVNPLGSGLTAKSFSNIRSNFMAAVKASGLKANQGFTKTLLSLAWKKLFAELSTKRANIGLSRLARYASANDITPCQVDDATIEAFINSVRNGTLHRKPNDLHRTVASVWNEAVSRSKVNLQSVKVPSFRQPPRRIDWMGLPNAFREEVNHYLAWCAGSDVFAANARSRPLETQTILLRRNQIHAAVTALVESGIEPHAINSLSDIVSLENFRRILRRRHEIVSGRENTFNHDLAVGLIRLAREWIKADIILLGQLRKLAAKVPRPNPGLTQKNKRTLRQFDDPATLRRLYAFSHRLWVEVKRDPKPDQRTLVKAQAALAIGILSYMPGLRLRNLAALTFDVHLFLHESRGAISTLELGASEVKNRVEIGYDIPAHLAEMLIEYRNRLAPKIIGHRPDKLFVNVDGTLKTQWTVAWTVRTYLRKRAGITLSCHQFRHLTAKMLLDDVPTSFKTVSDVLGHASDRTVRAYAGIDTRRAGRYHQRLIEEILANEGSPLTE
jgi:integrase